jgi:hypothetical protein
LISLTVELAPLKTPPPMPLAATLLLSVLLLMATAPTGIVEDGGRRS